jgi:hypothetical protein
MAIESVPPVVIEHLVNFTGIKRPLKCKRCKRYTEHVSVSYATTESSCFTMVFTRLLDYVPGVPIINGHPFACIKCGRIQSEGGLLSDLINKRNPRGL